MGGLLELVTLAPGFSEGFSSVSAERRVRSGIFGNGDYDGVRRSFRGDDGFLSAYVAGLAGVLRRVSLKEGRRVPVGYYGGSEGDSSDDGLVCDGKGLRSMLLEGREFFTRLKNAGSKGDDWDMILVVSMVSLVVSVVRCSRKGRVSKMFGFVEWMLRAFSAGQRGCVDLQTAHLAGQDLLELCKFCGNMGSWLDQEGLCGCESRLESLWPGSDLGDMEPGGFFVGVLDDEIEEISI